MVCSINRRKTTRIDVVFRTNAMNKVIGCWKQWAADLKMETFALYLAYKDPRIPFFAKLFVGLLVAYAFSPIDLIPDFIPVLGYLDDLILLPVGIALAIRMIPEALWAECREKAREIMIQRKPVSWAAVFVIIGIWTGIIFLVIELFIP
jgi:uncharacterized membrane protein YkvA (DUF1232 family)